MQGTNRYRYLLPVLLLGIGLIVAACGGGEADTPISSSDSSGSGSSDGRILAWVGTGERPGDQTNAAPGELLLIDGAGNSESIFSLPNRTERVMRCGSEALSPDGATLALLTTTTQAGEEVGALRFVRGNNTVEEVVTDVNPAACISTNFQWSPDGNRYAYLDLGSGVVRETSPRGFLHIRETGNNAEVTVIDSVTGYAMTDDGAALLRFFYNDDDLATEVGIALWSGGNNTDEIATLFANEDNNCFYNSGSITPLVDGRLAALVGYRCQGGNGSTQWQLYTVDPSTQSASQVATGNTGGGYFAYTASNSIFTAPDSDTVFFTAPDGVTVQTVSVKRALLDADAPQVTDVINRFGIMPNILDLPYDVTQAANANQAALTSPDGRFLAIVANTANGDATLNVIDMSQPDFPPIEIDAGDRDDSISEMLFTSDSSQLIYVAGGDDSVNNALYTLDLVTGTESRLTRGRYAQGVLSPDDTQAALMQWVLYDEDEAPYLSLVTVDLNEGNETTLYEGATFGDNGDLATQQFIYPLAWRE